jgi:hypothetical protein
MERGRNAMTEVEIAGNDPGPAPEGQAQDQRGVGEPGKLMRIAFMLRELQDEVRRAAPDEPGRDRLRRVHDRAIKELCEALSPELSEELGGLTFSFDEGTPSDSEILIAQAQLIGWLEGLFQGIQAAIVNQQLQARRQIEQLRQRALPPGARAPAQGEAALGQAGEPPHQGTGHYL